MWTMMTVCLDISTAGIWTYIHHQRQSVKAIYIQAERVGIITSTCSNPGILRTRITLFTHELNRTSHGLVPGSSSLWSVWSPVQQIHTFSSPRQCPAKFSVAVGSCGFWQRCLVVCLTTNVTLPEHENTIWQEITDFCRVGFCSLVKEESHMNTFWGSVKTSTVYRQQFSCWFIILCQLE